MREFILFMLFDSALKKNRDCFGWWKVQVGLTILAWLFTIQIILTIVEASCT